MDDVRAVTRAIARGDADAFASLYEDRFGYVLSVVRRRTGFDEQRSLDVVQDAFVKAIRTMRPLRDRRALDAWLARVATRTALDHLRAERRRRERESARGVGEPPAALDERIAWVRDELRAADRATADLLDLRYRAGLTLEAIGRRVGLSPGAVDGRIRRAETRMREKWEEDA